MIVLGIETSCDDTGAAVVRDGRQILSNLVASQDDLHAAFGGVVPEIAARRHVEVILPAVRQALSEAGAEIGDLGAVACTHKPGLIGSLLVGVQAARALGFGLDIPVVPIDHLEAHIYSVRLEPDAPEPPYLSLVASGGHTELFHWRGPGDYDRLGGTLDDAVGEAFDKVASMLGLGYPGGPAVERAAAHGNPRAIRFKRTLLEPESLDFSFSGLKTAVLYHLRGQDAAGGQKAEGERVADVAASFQAAVLDILEEKVRRAIARTGSTRFAMGGGVARNEALRARLEAMSEALGVSIHCPSPKLCTDNAAMVAGLAGAYLEAGRFTPGPFDVRAR